MFPILLIGKDQEAIETYINAFVLELEVSSYSVFKIVPKTKELSIDQIRDVIKETVIGNKETRVFIFYNFDTSSNEAQNAFLKTLEEQTEKNQFILVAQNENSVLPTIRSRSHIKRINDTDAKAISSDRITKIIEVVNKSASYEVLAEKYLQNITREDALSLLDEIIMYFQSNLSTDIHAVSIIKKALSLKHTLTANNLNPQLSIDSIVFHIKKIYS